MVTHRRGRRAAVRIGKKLAPEDRPVIEVVRLYRILARTVAVLALAAFCVAVVLAEDRIRLLIFSVVGCALWSGGMIFIDKRMGDVALRPLELNADYLPRIVSMRKAIFFYIGFMVALYAGAAALCRSNANQDYTFGIVLGTPILFWHNFRKAERVEHELHGTLWATTGFAWTAKDRVRYLTPDYTEGNPLGNPANPGDV
jgi:hypothetical protein